MIITINETPKIVIKNVHYTYANGTTALKNVNLSVNEGELIGIMGMNGAGKTTLIRTLNGLIRPQKGNVFINGENIKSKNVGKLSKTVGIIFQNPNHQLFSNSVEDEIKFSLKNLNLSKSDVQDKTEMVLDTFNLSKYKERSPLTLSGGETKKLALASIVCRDPDILVFDEPTLGQDAKEIEFFTDLIKNEIKKRKTIVIVTHNIEFAIENVPRTILMANGEIIADGPTEELLTKEYLINKCSLVLPQITKFNTALNSIGIKCPKDIRFKNDMIIFLENYLQNKKVST